MSTITILESRLLNGASTRQLLLDSARVPVALVQLALNETVTVDLTWEYLSSFVRPAKVSPLIEKEPFVITLVDILLGLAVELVAIVPLTYPLVVACVANVGSVHRVSAF